MEKMAEDLIYHDCPIKLLPGFHVATFICLNLNLSVYDSVTNFGKYTIKIIRPFNQLWNRYPRKGLNASLIVTTAILCDCLPALNTEIISSLTSATEYLD
ncbi:uncharacterized protein LOC142467265 isoform X2 [Ascaphus truei]|uniref:uncharacterized protein LOC142467263 isoform X3 n=1 Tax=Ascaphus truei TaxID=8439 RepID=UPI003F5A0201